MKSSQKNTEYNLKHQCKDDSNDFFATEGQKLEIQTFFEENCINKKSCEWPVPQFSKKCRDMKDISDQLILIAGCQSDSVEINRNRIQKKEVAYIIIAFDILSTFIMIYFFRKLDSLNREFLDITQNHRISVSDFSIVCRNVILDKYT